MSAARTATAKPINSPAQVLFASLIGTTIEFFDFYIYATAAVLVFPRLFFPSADTASATLASLATFAVAFFARPLGSAFFGHFGHTFTQRSRAFRKPYDAFCGQVLFPKTLSRQLL